MKKIISLLVVMAILLATCIMGANTVANALEDSPEADFMAFDGVIEEYVGPGGVVVIPQVINGEKVTEIAAKAFYQNQDITAVHIPEGVEIIGYSAFQECPNLAEVTLPYSLVELYASAFARCPISEIVIPGNVLFVGNWCFSNCGLTKITISYGVRELHPQAFCGNPGMDVVFPETVTIIGRALFSPVSNATRATYTICNPDCEVGLGTKNNACVESEKGEWVDGFFAIAATGHGAVNYKFIVPENSTVYKNLNDNKNTLYAQMEAGYHDNSITIITKDKEYFENLKENQKDWGITKPTSEEVTPGQDGGNGNTDGGNENGNGNGNGTGNGTGNTTGGNGLSNGNNGGNTNTAGVQNGNNNTVTIVLIITGAVLILIIAGVVVFAIIYLKKPKKKSKNEDETAKLLAQMAAKLEKLEKGTEETTEESAKETPEE